jgi:hypothetical protein
LKAVYHITVSSVQSKGAFNTVFDTGYCGQPTPPYHVIAEEYEIGAGRDVVAQVECESNV